MLTSLLTLFLRRFDAETGISSSEIRPCLTKYCFAEPHVAMAESNLGTNMLPVDGMG